jgi:hypothetical protein
MGGSNKWCNRRDLGGNAGTMCQSVCSAPLWAPVCSKASNCRILFYWSSLIAKVAASFDQSSPSSKAVTVAAKPSGDAPLRETYCAAAILSRPCRSWVKSTRDAMKSQCPLYPRKRTSELAPRNKINSDRKVASRHSPQSAAPHLW